MHEVVPLECLSVRVEASLKTREALVLCKGRAMAMKTCNSCSKDRVYKRARDGTYTHG